MAQAKFKRCGAAVLAVLMMLLAVPACNHSAYHLARERLPAGEGERTALRIREARDAAAGLLKTLQSPRDAGSSTPVSAANDLDGQAWDFSRRVSALEDVVASTADDHASDVLRAMRAAENAVQPLLEGSPAPDDARTTLQAAISTADQALNHAAHAGT